MLTYHGLVFMTRLGNHLLKKDTMDLCGRLLHSEVFFVFSRAKELIMNIVQQRSRTEGAGSSMGEMSMATGPGNHAHVSVTVLHNMVKMTGCCILWRT